MVFLHEHKKIIWKSTPFPKDNEDYKENVKIVSCDNAGKKILSKKIARIISKRLNLNLRHYELHRNMA